MTYHVQFLLLVLAGWVNRQQQDVIDYLQEENRVLRAGLRGKRLRLSDDDRRRLAVKAQALGREALLELEQLLRSPVPPDVVVKEEVLERPAKVGVVGDPLVQFEVGLDDLLDLVLNLGVEGQPHILARVHPGAGVEAVVVVEGRADVLKRDAVLGAEVQTESFV